jgi:hypothetical protein
MAEVLSASAPHLVVLQQLLKMVNSNSGWSFDVSALMVLIGEAEESKYRLMERSPLWWVFNATCGRMDGYWTVTI